MKKILISILVLIVFTSFSPLKKQWIITKKENIVLYSRPENFTNSKSPDKNRIQNILNEAIENINEINIKLETNFNSKVTIYIYNYDEAIEKIGTNQGGFADVGTNKICFVHNETPTKDLERNKDEYIGVHEYVHIVSYNAIGHNINRLFIEGYANAIDGHYGAKTINGIVIKLGDSCG